jgi:hypothetical protein
LSQLKWNGRICPTPNLQHSSFLNLLPNVINSISLVVPETVAIPMSLKIRFTSHIGTAKKSSIENPQLYFSFFYKK